MFNRDVNLAEEYHFASRNLGPYKFQKNEHLIHYRDDVLSLKTKKYVSYDGNRFELPTPSDELTESLTQTLKSRRSKRDFCTTLIGAQDLADLLYYSVGFRDIHKGLKHIPSSGGLNSVDVYAIVLSSKDVPLGIYSYDPQSHHLVEVKAGDFTVWVNDHLFFQEEYSRASVVLVLASAVGKLFSKYGLRSYRLSLMDVGIAAQTIYLLSAALNLKACASAGFIDEELDTAIGIDGFSTASFLTISIGV